MNQSNKLFSGLNLEILRFALNDNFLCCHVGRRGWLVGSPPTNPLKNNKTIVIQNVTSEVRKNFLLFNYHNRSIARDFDFFTRIIYF